MRAAQDRLKDALERGASPEEVQKLMAELRQALNHYLEALLLQHRPGKTGPAAHSPDAKTISPQELAKMLNKIESLAKAGSPEAAAQMLNELRDILESVQAGAQDRDGSGAENAAKLKQLDRLTDIMRQQQQIIDKTFRAQQGGDGSQNGAPGQQSQGGGDGKAAAGLKRRQEDVKKQLQDLLSGMKPGEDGDAVRQKLKAAEDSMGDASNALDRDDLGEAGDQEGRALESMRQGTRTMAEEMARAAGHGTGNNQTGRILSACQRATTLGDSYEFDNPQGLRRTARADHPGRTPQAPRRARAAPDRTRLPGAAGKTLLAFRKAYSGRTGQLY